MSSDTFDAIFISTSIKFFVLVQHKQITEIYFLVYLCMSLENNDPKLQHNGLKMYTTHCSMSV